MFHAIGEAGVHIVAAEMKIGLTGMPHWPAADFLRQIKQCRLSLDVRTRFLRHEAGSCVRARAIRVGEDVGAALAAVEAGFAAGFSGGGDFFNTGLADFAGAFFLSLDFTGDGLDFRPSRCALPITALRLTPPRFSAIWLAVEPFSHISFSVAVRSSVQLIGTLS